MLTTSATALRRVGPAPSAETPTPFRAAIAEIAAKHRPSRMPFFARLAALPADVARDPALLGEIHLVYQAAMHATRAAVYHLPYLDAPALRQRKLRIYIDDDGLRNGDTHHYQLTRAFRAMGAQCVLGDEEFGELELLCSHLDAKTARFVRLVKRLYARSLGPWCVVEVLSDDLMRSLAEALAAHYPPILKEPYFAECFSEGVEERHAEESLEITGMIMERRPELLPATLRDAERMASALDGVWRRLDEIAVRAAQQRH